MTGWRQSLRTKLAIGRAIRELHREDKGGALSQSAVAARSGFDRATVRRNYRDLSDALHLFGGQEQLEQLLACIRARSPDEPSLCMAVHACLDAVREVSLDKGVEAILMENAEFLGETDEGPALVLDYFMQCWFEPISRLLADRHGRSEPDLYDRMAAEQIFLLSRRVLDEWRRDDFKRDLSDITVDLIAQLGHHQADGSCLFAPPLA